MQTEIQTLINGNRFQGWTDISVTRTLGELCADFSFGAINFPPEIVKGIKAHDSVEIVMFADRTDWTIVTGYIDVVERSANNQGRLFKFSGRDKTCDLVDCSAYYAKSSWYGRKLFSIILDLCGPYDIAVDLTDVESKDVKIDKFTIKAGETVFQAIDRLCSAYNMLPLTNEYGDLRLTQVGSDLADTKLLFGANVVEGTFFEDYSGRYSFYQARGQSNGRGNEWLPDKILLEGAALDLQVTRYRPLVFMTEKKENPTTIQKRVNWEAQIRAGRAEGATVSVLGWLQEDKLSSRPWAINELVIIKDEFFGIEAELIVSSVTFSVDPNQGKMTQLELSPPEIFQAEPADEIELARKHSVRPD